MQYYYLLALLSGLLAIGLIDYRYRLVLFRDGAARSLKLICAAVGFFLVWDIAGLILGVFATNTVWVTGLYIATPNLPVEELLFLTFFSYTTLVTWRIVCLRIS